MRGKERDPGRDSAQALACSDCVGGLQEYLDGTQDKQESLRFFLHLRECAGCRAEHEKLKGLFDLLDSLPAREVPADFDASILASVPYAAYREMEPLRRERVPVYLTEHYLPGPVRSRLTRMAGLGLSAVAVVALAFLSGPDWLAPVAGLGVVPEALVRLQGMGRRYVAHSRAES